uniref:ATP synthase F0 subunit 8 n=1 Tax=Doto coronata TaxID=154624 RepID=UPI002551D9CD|nr:ATP synthase F0 subunit 8 [Doto coronata]WGC93413.1 ATP synthase F0 subunit 8 [Doto coronata]
MPQLSPMMGFMMFLFILSSYFLFISSISKKPAKVQPSKTLKSTKNSFSAF